MSRLVYAVEIDLKTYEHKICHIFELPQYGEQRFYRSVASYTAFFNGMSEKNYNLKAGVLYHANFKRDLDILKQYEETLTLPQKIYNNIWDFYKGIEYDYKKKRYCNKTS